MKKTKLLTSLAGLTALSSVVVPLTTLTSCNQKVVGDIKSIYVDVTSDYQTEYNVGDKLNLEGIKIIGYIDENTTQEIALKDCTVTPSLDAELTTDNKEVTIQYKNLKYSFEIFVYESVLDYDTTKIERFEPESEKKYSKQEVEEIYFAINSNQEKYQHIIDDVKGHISSYVQLANKILTLEESGTIAKEYETLMDMIKWLISFLIGTENNFIGKFLNCDINVTNVNVDEFDKVNDVAKLSGEINISLTTKIVDRTTDPSVFLDEDNYFNANITLQLNKIPYYMGPWQETGQDRAYWGLIIKEGYLDTHTDWSINAIFNATKCCPEQSEYKTYTKAIAYNKENPFEEDYRKQLINFLQFQSYYLDKIKG